MRFLCKTVYAPIAWLLLALGFISSCSANRSPLGYNTTGTAAPVPTVAPFFRDLPTVPPTSAGSGSLDLTPQATAAHTATASAESQIYEVMIYDDALSSNWTLDHSTTIKYNLQNAAIVGEGRFAIRADTEANFATLFFTLQPGAKQTFRRDETLGLRFRLSGGHDALPNDALAVTVVGSNRYPYWAPRDNSVRIEGRVTEDLPLFSETRLYYLDVKRDIPEGEWVDVYVWLDDLVYDPEYIYLTGFYFKTDDLKQFFLDDVTLIMAST